MFKNKQQITELMAKNDSLKSSTESYRKQVTEVEHNNKMAIERLKNEHSLALKEKEFELKHFKDSEIKKLETSVNEKNSKIEVLSKEVEMLGKIVDINADIIDIKDLVGKLIGKLPEVNLSNLTINTPSQK